MGLDNGIRIDKERTKTNTTFNPAIVSDSFTNEFLYWRKCWGLRDDIVNYLCDKYNVERDFYSQDLDIDDLIKIREIIHSWSHKKKWTRESRSIWSWKSIKRSLREDAEILAYLIALKEKEGDNLVLFFYDSY